VNGERAILEEPEIITIHKHGDVLSSSDQRRRTNTMAPLLSIVRSLCAAALFSSALTTPLAAAPKSKSFLTQVDNSTWVIGNGIWNVTQGRQYATKLFYKEKDRVGNAVGHYVSYSMKNLSGVQG
jgi:hypothetical protein